MTQGNTPHVSRIRSAGTGHRQRLRQRFDAVGEQGLADHEMLELLLTYAVPRRDTKPAAKELLRSFGSLPSVLDQSAERLAAVGGVGPESAALLRLVRTFVSKYFECQVVKAPRIDDLGSIARFLRARLGAEQRECLLLLCLNDDNRILHCSTVAKGTTNRVPLYAREIVREALLHNATGLILVHNHPACEPVPSDEDHAATKQIESLAVSLGMRFLDHVVVGQSKTFSLVTGRAV